MSVGRWQDGDMTANSEEPQTSAPPTPQGRIPADTFSNRLLLARALAGHLSIREACERTGLNRGNWQGWERGLRPRDQVEVSHVIAEALDVDFNWLLLGGPLEGPRGRVIPKRPGSVRFTYLARAVRATSDRPKVRTDQQRPMVSKGEPRRANRVNTERAAEVIYAA
jgi:transcriptional regulator with XRE-family HTH domain